MAVKTDKEWGKYKATMTIEEMRNLQLEYDRKMGREPLPLEQINQYIDEVRGQVDTEIKK